MDQWKLSSKQCAYLLDAIARSHSTIQTQLLERIVPELVVRFLGPRLSNREDIVTVMGAVGEMGIKLKEGTMSKLVSVIVKEAPEFSQEDLGSILKSLSKYELEENARNDLMQLLAKI